MRALSASTLLAALAAQVLLLASCQRVLGDYVIDDGAFVPASAGAGGTSGGTSPEAGTSGTGSGGVPPAGLCSPEQFQCAGPVLQKCNAEQNGWVNVTACASATLCDPAGKQCRSAVCGAGQQRCNGADLEHCNDARDGWEALSALLPPPQRRGLVLIDPPYEEPDELARSARALGPALKRFGHGAYLWWRPLKSAAALDAADAEARAQGAQKTLRADLWIAAPAPEGKLVASSLFVINPPFGLDDALRAALPFLAEALTKGQHGWRLS